MATNNANLVSAGKPKIGGAVYRSGASSVSLPTTASEDLASSFVCLGYCSDAGVVNSNTAESTDIVAWGGDVVLNIQTSKPDTFKLTLIEVLSLEVLKAVYGGSNVSGLLGSGITVQANATEAQYSAWVIDMVMRNGAIKRIVIPSGKITQVDDISYTDNAAVGYGITISAAPDGNGNTHYEYILRATSGT